jgi:hypothetical protein
MMVEGLSKPVKPIPIPERRDEVYRIILRRGCPPHIATRMADEIFAALLGDKKMESAETSDPVASRAGKLTSLLEQDILKACAPGNAAALANLASDIRSVAASALRQHEQVEITGSAEMTAIERDPKDIPYAETTARNAKSAATLLDEVTAIATDPGNSRANDYLHGMANGLILAQAIVHGTEPKFIEAPLPSAPARPTTFYDRLLGESKELEERKAKLFDFLGSLNFLDLPSTDQQLLRDQFVTMDSYAQILGQRIARCNPIVDPDGDNVAWPGEGDAAQISETAQREKIAAATTKARTGLLDPTEREAEPADDRAEKRADQAE